MGSGQRVGSFTERARRAQIVECAIELIAEVGYPQASIAKIAERAEIAKSAVLYHFTSKDEVVSAVVQTVFAASAALIIPAVSVAETAAQQLGAYIDANGEFLSQHRTAAIALFEIATSYRTSDGLRFDQAVQDSVDTHGVPDEFAMLDPRAIFVRGIEAGEFVTDTDPTVLKDALRAALDGAVANLARDSAWDIAPYIAGVRALFLYALGVHT